MSKIKNSQIATILTLIMAAIFLFVVITINIGNITQEKTMVSNAADGAALLLASTLGSLGNGLRMKNELYGAQQANCSTNRDFIAICFGVAGAVAAPILLLLGAPVVLAAAYLIGGLITGGLSTYNAAKTDMGFKAAALQFQNMSIEQMMKEGAIQYALSAIVNDPNKVCDNQTPEDPSDDIPGEPNTTNPITKKPYGRCIDSDDLDMDGKIEGDCISWFSKWYNDRLKAIPTLGKIVSGLYEKLFSHELVPGEEEEEVEEAKGPLIYVWEDPETWKVKQTNYNYYGENAPECGFWINTIDNNVPLRPDPKPGTDPRPEQGSLEFSVYSNAVSSDEPHDTNGVVYAYDIYFTNWLAQRFTSLVTRLYNYGYGFPEGLEATRFNILKLEVEIAKFGKQLSHLYSATVEERIQSFDEWILPFYNGTSKKDYCSQMQEWIDTVEEWIETLEDRTDAINECVRSCKAKGPYQCGGAWGVVCRRTCVRSCEDGGGCCDCDDISWCSCENGSVLNDGQLCPSNFCKPAVPCLTPPDGGRGGASIPCCTIITDDIDSGLYHPTCDATRITTGGSGGDCSAPECVDFYYTCGFNSDNNVITREHAIEYLQGFVDDVQKVKDAFEKAYKDAQAIKTDPRFYEVLYEWDDMVLKGQVGEQKVHHIAYVNLDKDSFKSFTGFSPDPEYKIPYPDHYNTHPWLGIPQICAEVVSDRGNFDITVARYDQDVGGGQSPLRNLWRFRTSRKLGEGETIPISKPTACACDEKHNKTITAFCVDPDVAHFVKKYGVVSQTRGYYGPGWTYTEEELKAGGTQAKMRNKDIRIERLR